MGSSPGKAGSNESKLKNDEINRKLMAEKKRIENTAKLILLGPSGAGKTTLLKQIRLIHCNGFSMEERQSQRRHVWQQFVTSLILLTEYGPVSCKTGLINTVKPAAWLVDTSGNEEYKVPTPDDQIKADLAELKEQHAQILANEDETGYRINQKLIGVSKRLLAEFKLKLYMIRVGRSIENVISEYIDDANRICALEYFPSMHDLIKLRKPTLGVTEMDFKIYEKLSRTDRYYKVIDVSGQKGARRKWMDHFDGIQGVIFFAALSDFNLTDEEGKNRMDDTLQCFNDMYHQQALLKASFILFLNKRDLFDVKLCAGVRLKKYFTDYKGDNTYCDAAEYFVEKFCAVRGKDKRARDIYSHLTCATETDHIGNVLNDCLTMLVSENMSRMEMA